MSHDLDVLRADMDLSHFIPTVDPKLIDTDPPENLIKLKMQKLEIYQQRF